MSGNDTASGGGEGGPTLDQLLFKSVGSSPVQMTTWAAVGAVVVSLLESKIIKDTVRYYDCFSGTDPSWVQVGVSLGTAMTAGQFLICCAQLWNLTHHAFTDYHNISKLDSVLSNTSDFIGALLNFTASTYYTWRAFKMSGRKWWLFAVLMLFNLATLVSGSMSSLWGTQSPAPTGSNTPEIKAFAQKLSPIRKSWSALSMCSDGLVCAVMMYYLFRSRTSVFHQEKKIYHKLNVLILETMLPPVICLFILAVRTNSKHPSSGDWRRMIRMMIPPLYFVSLIHSLVARVTIRRMLDDHLATEGIHKATFGRSDIKSTGGRSYPTVSVHQDDDGVQAKELGATDTDDIVPLNNMVVYPESAASSKELRLRE